MAVLKRVSVSWASVQQPNIQFAPTWEVQVHLNKEQAAQLVADAKAVHPKGIKPKKEDDGSFTYRFKRKVERPDGTENKPPVVCGPKGKDDVFTDLIGNGSICNVQYGFVAYDNKFGKGVTNDLKGIQVLEHVAFGTRDGGEFECEDEVSTPTNNANDSYDEDDFA